MEYPHTKSQHTLTFSHMGIYVRDLETMANFYTETMTFTQTDTGQLGAAKLVFLSRDPSEHHQIVLATGRPEELGYSTINQISFRVPDLGTLKEFRRKVQSHPLVTDLQCATHANAVSIYFRDPEKNRIEIFVDMPWYCEQPLRESIDLDLPDEQIMNQVHQLASSRPRFMNREVWIEEMKSKMGYRL
jgi:catechol-2,3-dioxygenase